MTTFCCCLVALFLVEVVLPLAFAFVAKHLNMRVKIAIKKCCAAIGAIFALPFLYIVKCRLRFKIFRHPVCQSFKELAEEFISDEKYGEWYQYAYDDLIHNLSLKSKKARVNRFYERN